jgi:hypothetical protein
MLERIPMTIEQDEAESVVKIRPGGPLWIAFFVLGAALLVVAAEDLTSGGHWFVLWLVLGCGNLPIGLALRVYGVDLTPEYAIVRNLRPRRVRWQEVHTVVSHEGSDGASLKLIFENDEQLSMPYPPQGRGRKGVTQSERDFQRIKHWWLGQGAEPYHPVRPEAPRGATQE